MKGIVLIYSIFIAAFLLCERNLQPILLEKDVTNKEGKLTYLTYGLPMADDYQEAKIAYFKYNLQFIGVAGCMVSDRLVDSLQNHNKVVRKLMNERFGYKWYDSLREQTKREYAFDSSLISLVTEFDYVRERQQKLTEDGNALQFTVDPNLGATIRKISACGYADTSSKWMQYFLFNVDYKTRKVLAVNREPKVLY